MRTREGAVRHGRVRARRQGGRPGPSRRRPGRRAPGARRRRRGRPARLRGDAARGRDVHDPRRAAVGRTGHRSPWPPGRGRADHVGVGVGHRALAPLPRARGTGLARQRPPVLRVLGSCRRPDRAARARHPPPQRLAHRSGAGLPRCAAAAHRSHHPHHRLPGPHQPRLAGGHPEPPGRVHPRRRLQPDGRRHPAVRAGHHREPHLRQRDPDPPGGRRPPGRAAAGRAGARRHPQRDRHDRVGPGDRLAPCRDLYHRRAQAEAALPQGGAHRARPARRRPTRWW